jgi:hypothetical protein
MLLIALLASAFAAAPALAQEDEEEEDDGRVGHVFFSVEAWMAQPAGLEFEPATRIDPADPTATELIGFDYSNVAEFRWRGGYELSKNVGTVVATYYSNKDDYTLALTSPGDFIYGETLTHPLFAGFSNDGLSDGFDAAASANLRDARLDFCRRAFKTKRVQAHWSVGYRRVEYVRKMTVEYAALVASLPPLVDPSLVPMTDMGSTSSDFRGRGIGVGMDFLMPLWQDKLHIEAGFGLAALRGKTDVSWSSTTQAYVYDDGSERYVVPSEEYGDLLDPANPASIWVTQETTQTGLEGVSRSTSAQVLETYLGFRWEAWRGLSVFGGFRSSAYDNVATDVRSQTAVDSGGINIQGISETDRSVTYEGFYLGFGYRF